MSIHFLFFLLIFSEGDNAIQQFIQQVTQEVEAYHGKRYLLLWPIESTTDYSNMYSFLNKISSYTASSQLTAAYFIFLPIYSLELLLVILIY